MKAAAPFAFWGRLTELFLRPECFRRVQVRTKR